MKRPQRGVIFRHKGETECEYLCYGSGVRGFSKPKLRFAKRIWRKDISKAILLTEEAAEPIIKKRGGFWRAV